MNSIWKLLSLITKWNSGGSSNTANNAGNTQIGFFNSILSVDINDLKIQLTIGFTLLISALMVAFGLICREIKKVKKEEHKHQSEEKQGIKDEENKEEKNKEKEYKKAEGKIEKKTREEENKNGEEDEDLKRRKKKMILDHQARCPSSKKLGNSTYQFFLNPENPAKSGWNPTGKVNFVDSL